MATFKALLVLSLFAVALTATTPTVEPQLEQQQKQQAQEHALTQLDIVNLAESLDQIFEQNSSIPEIEDSVDESSSRQKRACRRIRIRTRSGRIIIIIRCY